MSILLTTLRAVEAYHDTGYCEILVDSTKEIPSPDGSRWVPQYRSVLQGSIEQCDRPDLIGKTVAIHCEYDGTGEYATAKVVSMWDPIN